MKFNSLYSITVLAVSFTIVSFAQADTIQLVNGDSINGKVVSLDTDKLQFKSDILGEMTLPRDKVASIYFGDRKPHQAARTAQSTNARPGTEVDGFVDQLKSEKKPQADPNSIDTVVKQLQSGGVSDNIVQELQAKMPGFASPEVQKYFNEKVGGLMSGKIGIGAIRKDAKRCVDEIKELKKDLGPDADALNPYLNILENFIRKTEPKK